VFNLTFSEKLSAYSYAIFLKTCTESAALNQHCYLLVYRHHLRRNFSRESTSLIYLPYLPFTSVIFLPFQSGSLHFPVLSPLVSKPSQKKQNLFKVHLHFSIYTRLIVISLMTLYNALLCELIIQLYCTLIAAIYLGEVSIPNESGEVQKRERQASSR
jgi:hypothetical protein